MVNMLKNSGWWLRIFSIKSVVVPMVINRMHYFRSNLHITVNRSILFWMFELLNCYVLYLLIILYLNLPVPLCVKISYLQNICISYSCQYVLKLCTTLYPQLVVMLAFQFYNQSLDQYTKHQQSKLSKDRFVGQTLTVLITQNKTIHGS